METAEKPVRGFQPIGLVVALLVGLGGLVSMFVLGMWPGGNSVAILTTCALFLFGSAALAMNTPVGRYGYVLIVTAPLWSDTGSL